jgi:hypothetical protein
MGDEVRLCWKAASPVPCVSRQVFPDVAELHNGYPIIYRDWQSPRRGAFVGPLYRALGKERDLQATYGPPVR